MCTNLDTFVEKCWNSYFILEYRKHPDFCMGLLFTAHELNEGDLYGSLKERELLRDIDIDGSVILKRILKIRM